MQSVCFLLALVATASAHSFLTVPMPISTVETCRIGGNPGFEAQCGGPCPSYNFRDDMRPENPSATWERGEMTTIHYARNNHEGGFMRLTLVPIDEMNVREVHDVMSFYFGCWSAHGYTCSEKEHHRDCGFDLDNRAFKTDIVVPPIYPDGVYVLGWTWYGGGENFGSFGDYYDCAYVRIKGGPLEDSVKAKFRPGQRHADGCQSSVDRLGVCTTEPCGQELWSKNTVPIEIAEGERTIYRDWYEQALARPANQVQVSEHDDFGITAFSLYDTGTETKMEVDLEEVVDMSGVHGITVVPEMFGHVDRVEWIVNGRHERTSVSPPFSISGSQGADAPSGRNFYDWPYPIYDKRVFVTAVAHSGDRRVYHSQDLWFRRGS